MRKNTKKISFISLITLVAFVLSGCWDQTLFEKTGFILEMGFEYTGPNKIKMTYTSPVIEPTAQSEIELISVDVNSDREAREQANLSSARNLEGGKVQQLLFSNDLACNGINSFLEIFERDPTDPALAWVVVVNGSPSAMLKESLNFPDKPRAAFYINRLLEKGYKRSITPHTQIYDFDIDNFAPGLDPITPMLQFSKNGIIIAGSALFHGDKMTGSVDTGQTQILLGAMGEFLGCDYFVKAPAPKAICAVDKSGVALSLLKCKRKIKISFDNNVPVVDLNLNYTGILNEGVWGDSEVENMGLIEKYAEKDMEYRYAGLFKKLKDADSDPIGIGNIIRAKYNRYWKSVKWDDIYPNVKFNVKVKVNLTSEGVFR